MTTTPGHANGCVNVNQSLFLSFLLLLFQSVLNFLFVYLAERRLPIFVSIFFRILAAYYLWALFTFLAYLPRSHLSDTLCPPLLATSSMTSQRQRSARYFCMLIIIVALFALLTFFGFVCPSRSRRFRTSSSLFRQLFCSIFAYYLGNIFSAWSLLSLASSFSASSSSFTTMSSLFLYSSFLHSFYHVSSTLLLLVLVSFCLL